MIKNVSQRPIIIMYFIEMVEWSCMSQVIASLPTSETFTIRCFCFNLISCQSNSMLIVLQWRQMNSIHLINPPKMQSGHSSAVFPIKILVMNWARYLYWLISLHGHLCLPLLLSILLNCSINWFQSLKGEYLKISSVSTAYFSGSKVIGSFVFKSHEGSGTITCKDTIMETGYTTIWSMCFCWNIAPLNEKLILEFANERIQFAFTNYTILTTEYNFY